MNKASMASLQYQMALLRRSAFSSTHNARAIIEIALGCLDLAGLSGSTTTRKLHRDFDSWLRAAREFDRGDYVIENLIRLFRESTGILAVHAMRDPCRWCKADGPNGHSDDCKLAKTVDDAAALLKLPALQEVNEVREVGRDYREDQCKQG
ncbi:MAG: hypothetical protein KDC95_24075, partial [Planctomycetes bacterium]|nr:hypothetical protein [Planctomycetota bacterium]